MGLNLLEIIELQFPLFFNNFDPRATAANFPSGVQAYLAGLTFALADSPYSSPVLATLLGYIAASREMEVMIPDPCIIYSGFGMVESKLIGTFAPLQKQDSHRGLFVDSGVGSPKLVKSASATNFSVHLRLDSETKNVMPTAAGAVATTTVADQMLGVYNLIYLFICLNKYQMFYIFCKLKINYIINDFFFFWFLLQM